MFSELISQYPLIQNDYRQEKITFELFSGALQENPVIAPGQLHEKCLPNYFGNHVAVEGNFWLECNMHVQDHLDNAPDFTKPQKDAKKFKS